MNVNDLSTSKYLRKEDCGSGIVVTIKEVYQENIGRQGEPSKLKWCMSFVETEKPLVLNPTNGQLLAQITGSAESDPWIGKKIVLYHEPSVTDQNGKLVGGIRVRAPRPQAPSKPVFHQPRPAPVPAQPVVVTQAPIEPGPVAQEFDEHGNPVGDDSVPF